MTHFESILELRWADIGDDSLTGGELLVFGVDERKVCSQTLRQRGLLLHHLDQGVHAQTLSHVDTSPRFCQVDLRDYREGE